MKDKIKDTIEKSPFEKAKDLNIVIENYEIIPDHIHIFIKCNPKQCVANIVGQLKGYSSYKLRSEYPKYRKYPTTLRSPSYYCESVGHISVQTVKNIVRINGR